MIGCLIEVDDSPLTWVVELPVGSPWPGRRIHCAGNVQATPDGRFAAFLDTEDRAAPIGIAASLESAVAEILRVFEARSTVERAIIRGADGRTIR